MTACKRCKNCRTRKQRPGCRGLCRACWGRPHIRARYPKACLGTTAAALKAGKPLCRHCQQRAGSKGWGLCSVCHRTPEVYALYARPRHYWRRGDEYTGPSKPPATPCVAPVGSRERLLELKARVERGEALHDVRDSREIVPELLNPFPIKGTYHGGEWE